jgi:hypothetical protein
MTWHIMVAEIFIKNRFDALLRPIVGINYDRNAPLIKADDTRIHYFCRSQRRTIAEQCQFLLG